MEIEFDPAKNERNMGKHKVSLALAAKFDFPTAFYDLDMRQDYREVRTSALGFIGKRLYVMVFTMR